MHFNNFIENPVIYLWNAAIVACIVNIVFE